MAVKIRLIKTPAQKIAEIEALIERILKNNAEGFTLSGIKEGLKTRGFTLAQVNTALQNLKTAGKIEEVP